MKKEKYVNQNKQMAKNKIFKTIIFLTIFVLILLSLLALIENFRKQPKYNTEMLVKETLEDFGCTFLKMKNSTEDNFVYDIDTIFQHDLYEEEQSQEEFYNQVIQAVAKVLQYKNFRLLDNNKKEKIEIKVICSNNKVQKVVINGREDYFIFMNSQKDMRKFTKIDNTDLIIQAKEILECMQNDWKAEIDFGTRESIFQNYYIYFDEGIEVRKINGKIYNIIFTKNYKETVVNGFTVGEKRDIIERELGTPTLKNDDESIIGYKSGDIYVFFEENQISIYRNTVETGFDDFFELTDKFLKSESSLLEFMNELTYVWPDYEEYVYDSNTAFLSYPNKGIDIKINYDNSNGIVLYNNIGIGQEEVNKHLQNTEFIANLQMDNVTQAEIRRVSKINNFENQCKEYQEKMEKEDTRNRGAIYNYYVKFAPNDTILSIYFISQKEEYPNCELNENIKSYIWAKDDYFIYSIDNKGIYYYDLKNQAKGVIVTGKESFAIKSLENGILSYDDKMIPINN